MMRLDDVANKILIAAYNEAKHQKHEFFTPEHILYASLFFDEGRDIIENCGGKVEDIKKDLLEFFRNNMPIVENHEPIESLGINSVMQATAYQCIAAGREYIRIGDIIVALYGEKESFASYILQKNGIKKLDVLKYISHGVSLVPKNMETSLKSLETDTYLEAYQYADDWEYDYEYEDIDEDEDIDEESSSKSNFLEHFTIDLTEKARKGKIDPLIGREDILERTIQVLSRRLKNNPIHVGDPGVGKTAITEGLARLIVEDKVPKSLKGSKIYYLDMGSMLAGTKYRGDFEERIKKVLNEIQNQPKAIVYIDEIHTIVGAGAVSDGAMDASNIIKPFLTQGTLRFIGSTTYEEYKKYFEKDRALSRRFQKIDVPEPSIDDTFKILKGLKDRYEEYHKVKYTDSALRLAAELSAKYIQDRHLPDKAIDVIDETGAYVRLHAKDEDKVITIKNKDIERTVSAIARIPIQSVSRDEISKLKNLDVKLKSTIFGQDKAIDTVVQAIKRSRAGFNENEKPVASLLFVGPTGVGKTELAKQLSLHLGIPFIRFDMSEYQEKHTVSRLIGAPPGYVGYEEGGLLTDAIRKTPHCVLLLDEIEKAHPDIYNVLLQVMDYAVLTDNNGKKADFRNVILIMTSNAGAREVGRTLIGFDSRNVDRSAMTKEVERIFSPEFRNRLDDIVVFNHINEEMALLITKKAINQFKEKLKTKNIKLKVTERCCKWIAQKGLSSIYGAREILRYVQDKIKTYFVDEVLFGELSKGGTAIIDVVDGEIKISKKTQR
ncbi:MAG TPA: ATP-dependent Clp protease ATP-binding subunit ClpA [Hungateiclostridium thermocellum]|jgi:ATP-dependent Clp protease ATP-binding subunit ClpA|uniref:ATP-dependent Clp protease, ATP-binding subunit clpA n=2 Tax=Acetivibrio thermocellus TaxID=1515 RepID=A3DES0_ACET2|nr:ATP-dependent Clp protease ATP-binding subunit ClpA [Acetivibrio thermocellus]CDG35888.1 ClpA homolog protein [Acetivibrio thermocellus BC1]ABN52449.1 ATP-dependent Clp protease, ATP-binding subunit clpA [Acetivibrio thermocellus ATCC 27405]ADU74108.1 ATP-dependent Clp protease, ATP-binding subunit clpA [Acetivibrio thermocellus DSM 1313]ALX08046.1 ATP-dependent Clp protease, ATP-binding subunit clpA [Acetivibrio thermocellus AD2]ANV75793.1 ATP-dependent Clp protease, ATP-binding subunit cl